MNIHPTQIVQSAQVWVCRSCKSQDHKSCSCNSAADMEILAEAREKDRQRKRRERAEKAEQNQSSRPADANIENIKESSASPFRPRIVGDDDEPEDENEILDEANDLNRELLEFITDYSSRALSWHKGHPDFPARDRKALVANIYQCAEEVRRLAQRIDGR